MGDSRFTTDHRLLIKLYIQPWKNSPLEFSIKTENCWPKKIGYNPRSSTTAL